MHHWHKIRWLPACLAFLLFQETRARENPLPPALIRFRDTIACNLPFGAETKAVFRLDSSIHYDFSPALNGWIPSLRYRYFYREDGKLKSYVYYTHTGENWITREQTLYHYQEGFLSLVEKQLPAEDGWEPFQQTIYERSPSGKLTLQLTRAFDPDSGDWINKNRYLFDYDSCEQLVRRTYQVFSETEWTNNNRFLYAYQSGTVHETVRQKWNASLPDWVNDTRQVYAWSPEGEFLYEVQYHWEDHSGWIPRTRISYKLDGWNEVVEKLYEQYDTVSQDWLPAISYVYQHDKPGADTAIVYRVWDKGIPGWEERYRYLFSYDPFGNLSSEIWQDKAGEWINDYRIDYFGTRYPDPLRVEITDSTNVSCYGFADGKAEATATGGVPPYSYLWDDPGQTTGPVAEDLPAGVWIHVVVTDAAMNTATDSVLLSEPPPVITGEIEGPVIVSQGETVQYIVSSGNYASVYTWNVKGGYILTGQGTPQVEIVWTSPDNPCVQVWETNAAGCPGDTSVLYVIVRPVYTGNPYQTGRISVFPNPASASGPVYVDFPEPFTGRWEVCDSSGRVILSGEIHNKTRTELFVNHLPPGFYLIRFRGTTVAVVVWISG